MTAELRINLVFLAILGLVFAGLSTLDPATSIVTAARPDLQRLAHLEDSFARSPDDRGLVLALSDAYLVADRPGMAAAVLHTSHIDLMSDPMALDRLAHAYEGSARVLDALATSNLAVAKCGRRLGTADSANTTPVPAVGCDAGDYARLEMHRGALERMAAWGVADPRLDPRAGLAYDLAQRRARIASAD